MPLLVIATASGQDDLLDDLPRSGLVGHYQDAAGNSHRRVDTAMSFDWSTRSPVPHLAEGAFTVTWKGLLRVRSTGSYRFAADAIGAVAVLVNDKALFESDTSSRQWVTGDEVELRAGLHDLSIRFTKRADDASMRLFWSGSKFDWEPVNPGNMLHYSEDEPDAAMARGGALVEALRCTACHDVPGSLETLQAPAIDRLAGNLNLDWLIGRLMRAERKPSSTSKMPHFALSQPQAIAVTAYLVELSEKKHRRPKPLPKVKPPRKKGKTIVEDPVKRGEQLVVSLGCLSCHQAGELGESGLLGGGKLARSIAKRPDEFFQRWLHDPSQINKHHRMPIFELTQSEASDLASYLAEADGGATETRDPTWLGDDSLVELGKQLVQQHRCAACHSIDEELRPEAFNQRTALTAASDWTEACTGTDRLDRPNYRLHGDDQIAVEKFVRATTAIEQPTSRELDGHDLLRRSNCLACHKRGTSPGNSVTAMTVANQFAGIVEHVAALSPPSLNAIGDKFQDESLKRVIQGKAEPRRDWLSIRMPKFRLSDRQVQQLSDWFIHQDRVPQPPPETGPSYGKDQLLAVGPRLVTSNGFGCTSCHAVGSVSPTKAPVNTRGPNLAGLDKSMRKAWFTRWVADPLRVVPRVEMPAITVPINGVLDDDLDRQIDAVWHVLNLEGFRPPKPDPVRVVRQSGLDASARVHLLTDVLRLGDDQYIKPLLVGLPNRHNVLIDLSENQIAGWWLGDTALQQTEGKTWYWEAGGSNLLDSPSTTASDMVLVTEDTELQPLRRGQFLTELDAWEHTPDGLLVSHRLMFSRDGSAAVTVRLEQRFSAPEQNQKPTGWARQIRVDGLPAGNQLRIRPAPSSFQLKGGSLVSGSGAAMRVAIDPTNSDARRQIEFESDGSVLLASDEMVRLRYTTELPVDILTIPGSSIELSKTVLLDVVPGFTATELALPGDVLPTGLSWDSNGTLFVSELKGRVIRVIDSDLDGMPDKANTFGDELAAPFGLKAHDGYVDVINKYALLRLHDADNDGTAERVETLASGWGHTADYHDWAVGLPQTPTGEYLAAFPCQQDDRSQAAANLRGTVVRLIPQQPTADNPHRFRIDTLTAGHRFPIGIARNRAGDLFVTDNQGNYNPFNELNHIVPGKRYGFINKLDRSPDFNPPLTPPAIDIPHPWTRSVNGICFLETPPDLEDSVFGPFEGHLVGCEYDTRRLIRMSLQRVGDTIQGAAYPLSYDEPPTGAPMLGPIACAVAPDGAIYIGNLRESGWGAGQNIGGVVRLELDEATLPVGIAEVRAHHDGFSLRFTGDLAARLAEDPANYSIQSYTRESTSQYGGDDIGNRSEVIKSVRYDVGKRTAFVELAELRRGYVYEFNLNHLLADEQAMLFPARAFYTLRSIPE
jgi:mono/diheme cytochrome c family protein